MCQHHEEAQEEQRKVNPVAIVSGGFDPVHVGHIRMFQKADEFYEFAPKFGVRPNLRGVLHLAALKVMKEKKDAEAALRKA